MSLDHRPFACSSSGDAPWSARSVAPPIRKECACRRCPPGPRRTRCASRAPAAAPPSWACRPCGRAACAPAPRPPPDPPPPAA
eukprot:6156447-Prymnesium_polylepis.1